MIPPSNDHALGANLMAEAIINGTHANTLGTVLDSRKMKPGIFNGALQVLMQTCADLRKDGADLTTGLDDQSADFMRKSQTLMLAEIQTADYMGAQWRLRTLTGVTERFKPWIKSISVVDNFPKQQTAAPQPVQVVSMPDRVSVQSVERDKDGDITSTTTVQKDFA